MDNKNSNSVMMKIAKFIVDKRKAIYLVFIFALIFCIRKIDDVKINNDITSYLPKNTETRIGLSLMEKEFTTLATAQILIDNVTYNQAENFKDRFENIHGINEVKFNNSIKHYKDSKALYNIMFDGVKGEETTENAMNKLKSITSMHDTYIVSEVGQNMVETLKEEMSVILIIASFVILAVLLITSTSYAEIPVFLIVFAVSAILNMGTNYIFGEISFITNAIAVVLQLALAVDYAIIFCHRYVEEKNTYEAREACIISLSKSIIEISSSSLTTISGLVALMLMQLKIGFDMGIVLSKGILCSLITVFLLMPALLMLFNKHMEKTKHKNFVPDIKFWGKIVVKTRFIVPVLFLVVLICGVIFSNSCEYVFSIDSIETYNKSKKRIAMDKINETFTQSDVIALLVPKGNFEKEKNLIQEVMKIKEVTDVTALASIEIEDNRMLTDKISPRQFSELASVDIELSRLLFQAYGLSVKEYGSIFQDVDEYSVPLLDIFLFLCEQNDKGVISLTQEQEDRVNELKERLDVGLKQLQGENWSRIVFNADVPLESVDTYELMEKIRDIASSYYGKEVLLVGNSTNAKDLSDSFTGDNIKISVLTVLFVMIILLVTFKSAGIPILLILTIQGSIWINFSFPYLKGSNMFFLSYLIVSAIQMGATIDYAIVITNRYMALKEVLDRKQAMIEAINASFPTIFTSGTMMTSAGFIIARLSTDPTIGSIGLTLGRGTLISIILVMTVLPQLLVLGDIIIEKTAITLNLDKKKHMTKSFVRLDGRIRGYVSGYIDGNVRGILRGDIRAMVESKDIKKIDDNSIDNDKLKEYKDLKDNNVDGNSKENNDLFNNNNGIDNLEHKKIEKNIFSNNVDLIDKNNSSSKGVTDE